MRNRVMRFMLCGLLLAAACLFCGCGSREGLVEPTNGQEDTLHEPIPVSQLYNDIPDRIQLVCEEGQALPWSLDAEVWIPQGLERADILNAKLVKSPVQGEWEEMKAYFMTPEELSSLETLDDEEHKAIFSSDSYVKNLLIPGDGRLLYTKTQLVMRSVDDPVVLSVFEENADAQGCSLRFEQAQQTAQEALSIVQPAFESVLWRAGALQPDDNSPGCYLFLYSQVVSGLPIANPAERGGDYNRLYVPELAGGKARVNDDGVRHLYLEAVEVTSAAQAVDRILSLEDALTLFRLFVRDGKYEADTYHARMKNLPLQADEATLNRVSLCYILSLEAKSEYSLIPCWLFSGIGSSSSYYALGVGFHAVTGEVVWYCR